MTQQCQMSVIASPKRGIKVTFLDLNYLHFDQYALCLFHIKLCYCILKRLLKTVMFMCHILFVITNLYRSSAFQEKDVGERGDPCC